MQLMQCVSTVVMVTQMKIRTYSELIALKTFEERFEYLRLDGIVGKNTFGYDRYLNQVFYRSREWRSLRDQLIIRDNGCDLAMEGHEIYGSKIIVHHMNPLTKWDISNRTEYLMKPEYLICTMLNTHNAIHYGDESLLIIGPNERSANDTCPWKN